MICQEQNITRKALKELRSVILMELDIFILWLTRIFFCKENKLKELEMKRIV